MNTSDVRPVGATDPRPITVRSLATVSTKLVSSNTTRAFVTFSAPAPMYADRLIEAVAEAMIGLGRYTQATAYLDGATNTLGLDIMRARLYNKLAEPAKALSLLEPLRASKALSLPQLGIVNYEYGRAMMNTSTNYDEALDAFLRVKVFYRPDQATIARSEMGAVACYRALNEFGQAIHALSNIVGNAEYAIVTNEAAVALGEVIHEIEQDRELKRRFGEQTP